MPSWWGKSSYKDEKKKTNRESIFDIIQRKLRNASEVKGNVKLGRSRRHPKDSSISRKGSISVVSSRSTSPSAHVTRCQSSIERLHSQPLSQPSLHFSTIDDENYGISKTSKLEGDRGDKPSLYFAIPEPVYVSNKGDPNEEERYIASASLSSNNSIYSGDSSSTNENGNGNGNKATTNSSYRLLQKDRSPITIQGKSRASSKPDPQLCNSKLLSTSQKRGHLDMQDMQITRPSGGLHSALDSSRLSPSRSSMRADIASGHYSSSGSSHNTGNNSVCGETSRQIFWQHNRCSNECSPIPSPKMTSSGSSSKIQNVKAKSDTRHPNDAKQKTHGLPHPLISVTGPCPFSPTYSSTTSPSAPRSPATLKNPSSPGSPWKKGRFIGRGSFGDVYLGFNSENGEMCAMKEVTLFSDDPKSRESVRQLSQEIALLNRLRHPNIVQYYGSEMVDDKLYIYLEYVSGGSIYKLLRQYGQFSEFVVRNYTRQILYGLVYLHAKNTVHRDIKGANILVDPNGWIKLADFGVAKHISGQSCPFSFKGSPYWMAPEIWVPNPGLSISGKKLLFHWIKPWFTNYDPNMVIQNSNGCNLAVDIWSLGCTVLEMATTNPPWSQYEGVAAMFKIGISKEFPTIPDHLSEDGKDFVKLCLQRNPQNRPSAAQLLEHPFVKNDTLERPTMKANRSEAQSAVINAMKSLAIGPEKHNLGLDSEVAAIYPPISLRTGSGSSDAHTQRNFSCPVSSTMSQRLSPSPISSPHTASGSSTPRTGGGGAIPFHHIKQPILSYEAMGMIQKPNKHDQFRGFPQTNHGCSCKDKTSSSDNDTLDNHNRRTGQENLRELHDEKSCLADRVSQQLLRDYVRLNISLDVMSSSPKD